jgi:hypothetical protein
LLRLGRLWLLLLLVTAGSTFEFQKEARSKTKTVKQHKTNTKMRPSFSM